MNFTNFFSNIQERPWYRVFLNPVINEVPKDSKLLDIGTGSGKMIQILTNEKQVDCIGVDTNADMLAEAKEKLKSTNTELIKIVPNEVLPFDDNLFDTVTICSVLFHLDNTGIDFILGEARRVLKENGKIIVLTPTGAGNFFKLTQNYFSLENWSIIVWYFATKSKAKKGMLNNYLMDYTANMNLKYKSNIVMNGFAQLEIIKNK